MSLEDLDVYSRTALALIREIVRESRVRQDTALLEFCRSWYIVAVSYVYPFTSLSSSAAHMPLRRAALVDFGDHPEILLVVGSYGFGPPAAEATLRRVLALDPLLVEARVQLGRLLYQTGHQDEAGRELERAVRDAHAAENVTMEYLGRLHLGRFHEDAGRMEDAAKCYEAAAALNPSWQVAHVALGSLRVALGETDEGWALGRVALDSAPLPSADPEPWYIIHRAQSWQTRRRIESMRAAVRP